MNLRLYCDEDSMDQEWLRALRARGMDVTTALEENMISRGDERHLDYATQQGRDLSGGWNALLVTALDDLDAVDEQIARLEL